MRWVCGAPSWAWCCSARGMNYGRRWGIRARLRREGRSERRKSNARRDAGAGNATSGRNDVSALHRAAAGPDARAGSFRARTGLRSVPHAAARAGARIAAADARHAGRRGALARAADAISGAGAPVDAMDLGNRVRLSSDGYIRALYG